ncbi:MAG: N-acetyltransferase [Nocardia sp.]|uniref:GNAT family N-acetyltransferase n=1 Tax=Nocardia sp. TaxID=1821 RepID=UPI0026016DB0|nr:GNAT family protein [Nocardia sp.]MCU1641783.1 N-acetyltransferase [Nocardia sp.]
MPTHQTTGEQPTETPARLRPIALEGKHVRLEPVRPEHHDGLCAAFSDGNLWELAVTFVPHPDDVGAFIEDSMEAAEAGTQLVYATIDIASGRIAGTTRFLQVNLPHKRTEIGGTFLGKSWQRTPVNTEAKLLMLTYAFEDNALNRVEFLTDVRNTTSRAAIARLGATHEGILRSHMVMRDGHIRDSILFSITAAEWPGLKTRLTDRLAQ